MAAEPSENKKTVVKETTMSAPSFLSAPTPLPSGQELPRLRGLAADDLALNPSPPALRHFFLSLVVWLIVVVLATYFGVGQALPALLRGPIVVAGIIIPVLVAHFYVPFRHLVRAVPDATIAAFHGWRILAGFVFLLYGAQGLLPAAFARNAGWGDIAVGLLVPFVLLLPESRRLYVAFHLFGLADFVIAVGSGLYFTALHAPLQANLFAFPIVLIPWFGVGLSGASHLITLARLLPAPKV